MKTTLKFLPTLFRAAPLSVLTFLIVMTLVIFAGQIAPYDPNQQFLIDRLQPPSADYWLGTDHLGRDLFSRLIFGGRFSLLITLTTLVLSGVIGTAIGLWAGRRGGWVDELLMRLVDLVIALPTLIIALVIIAFIKPGFWTIVIAVISTGWTTFARLARASTLEVCSKQYILAAEMTGITEWRILAFHVLPNMIGPVLALFFIRFGHLLILISGLSFLGLGAQPPTADWGVMLADAQPYMQRVPSLILAPGLTITLTAISITLIGQKLSVVVDPLQSQL